MAQTARSPFAGTPATWQVADANGNPAFRIEPRILTPLRASMVNILSGVAAVGLFIYSLGSLAGTANADGGSLGAAVMVPVIGAVALHGALKSLFRKRVKIMMTLERFSVRGLFGWKHFDRLLPHRFAVLPHDWQQAERDQDEYRMQQAQLRKQPMKKARLYANSFHISFDYLGQRNDLMTVFGQKDAVAIAMRLKACDDVLDAFVRRGQGTPLSPQDEWGDQPGAIPAEYV
jgi:hypothetical protein